ncbi:hypothetical protein QCA50_004044 [Cerrena zonata]|uniref:NAD(P)-binding protein n=1 Tax=Cerrena zonata TaxID=2478898 RepID=A0AAW0GMP2_9APHY
MGPTQTFLSRTCLIPQLTMPPRVAFVTGAAQGIGEAIALRLASDSEDICIVILDVPEKELQMDSVVKKIQEKGKKAFYVAGDVSVEEQVKNAVDRCVEVFGGLDIMVANAGIPLFKSFIDCTAEDFHRVLNVNLLGVVFCYQYAAKQMIKQGRGGRIIGACSGAGKQGVFDMAFYSASKAGVRGLTQSVALELRPHNITVNAYAPGVILTAMSTHPDDDKHGGPGSVAKMAAKLPADTPAAEPEVIAEMVAYLVSPKAYFTTGQTICVNGGRYCD